MIQLQSFLANSPPDKWLNKHEEIFEDRLHDLAGRFSRAQQLVFAQGKSKDTDNIKPVRISLSKIDGSEKGRVLQLRKSEMEQARELAKSFKSNLPEDKSIALAALYDLFGIYYQKMSQTSNSNTTFEPFADPSKPVRHIVSMSGGKDSTALALHISQTRPELDVEYVFCDTGSEMDETYQYLNQIEAFLGKKDLETPARYGGRN